MKLQGHLFLSKIYREKYTASLLSDKRKPSCETPTCRGPPGSMAKRVLHFASKKSLLPSRSKVGYRLRTRTLWVRGGTHRPALSTCHATQVPSATSRASATIGEREQRENPPQLPDLQKGTSKLLSRLIFCFNLRAGSRVWANNKPRGRNRRAEPV